MRIGVFGDSFASAKSSPQIWWKQLSQYGHEVQSHGHFGSSIAWSADLIVRYAEYYDFLIWCVTTPGRYSVALDDDFVHLANSVDSTDVRVRAIGQAVDLYKQHIFDWKIENMLARALVEHIQSRFANLLIIPCFPPPTYIYPEPIGFNLFHLSEREAQNYFPGQGLGEIFQNYDDLRPGHLTPVNNAILAKQVADNLSPGVFVNDFNNFETPKDPLYTVFERKQ